MAFALADSIRLNASLVTGQETAGKPGSMTTLIARHPQAQSSHGGFQAEAHPPHHISRFAWRRARLPALYMIQVKVPYVGEY